MKKNNITTMKALVATLFIGMSFIIVSNTSFGADESTKQVTSSSDYTVLAPLPCIEGNGVVCENGGNGALQPTVSFKTYIQYTINLLIGLSAVIAVVMIVWGGIEYMYTASFTSKKEGMDRAKNAIYGLVLILVSYILLRTIDPRLVEIPNTLVPQIEVKEWLQQDVRELLKTNVYNFSEAAKKERLAVSTQMTKTAEENKAIKEQIIDINNQQKDVDQNTPEGKAKFNELELAKIKAADQSKTLDISYQTDRSKIIFNDILDQAATIITSTSITNNNDVVEKMKMIDAQKVLATNFTKSSIEKLKKLGAEDLKTIENQSTYTLAILDLNKLNLSTVSAQEVPGAKYSVSYQTRTVTELALVDGTMKMFAKPSEAKDYIKNELMAVAWAEQQIKGDEKLQAELQNQIDIATKRLETNAVLNKTK